VTCVSESCVIGCCCHLSLRLLLSVFCLLASPLSPDLKNSGRPFSVSLLLQEVSRSHGFGFLPSSSSHYFPASRKIHTLDDLSMFPTEHAGHGPLVLQLPPRGARRELRPDFGQVDAKTANQDGTVR